MHELVICRRDAPLSLQRVFLYDGGWASVGTPEKILLYFLSFKEEYNDKLEASKFL